MKLGPQQTDFQANEDLSNIKCLNLLLVYFCFCLRLSEPDLVYR